MTKNIMIWASVVVGLGLVVWLIFRADNPAEISSVPTVSPPMLALTATNTPSFRPLLSTVHLTAQGPTPKTLNIRAGDGVVFINDGDAPYWPISECSGFDAGRALATGESYTLVFTNARRCEYRNNLDPQNQTAGGAIIIR